MVMDAELMPNGQTKRREHESTKHRAQSRERGSMEHGADRQPSRRELEPAGRARGASPL